MLFHHSVPVSECALVVDLAPTPPAAGTLLPGLMLIQERAGSAAEVWMGSNAGWEVEAGTGA